MTLNESHKKYLRGLGHKLKPVLIVAQAGLTESVLVELESALAHHELIKVRVRAADRETRNAIIAELCRRSAAELVMRTGNTALLFRRNVDKPKVRLPGGRTQT